MVRAKSGLTTTVAVHRAIALPHRPVFPRISSMPTVSIAQAFALAVQHFQSGRLAEAEALYRQILAVEPRHAEALHHLGVIAHEVGKNDVAVGLIRQALALKPNYPDARYDLGIALKDQRQLDEAITAYREAVTLKPEFPEAHNNLGIALMEKGDLDAAIAAYRQAIALKPDYSEAYNNLGNALQDKRQLDEAIAAFHQALALRPNYPEASYNLGNALRDQGQLDEAVAAYREAIVRKPDLSEAHSNLGTALQDKGQLAEAIAAYRQAIALKPNLPEAHSNLGDALRLAGQPDEAIAAYRQAIALKFDYPETHSYLALALLGQGDFLRGWEEYEWRLKLKEVVCLQQNFTQPRWEGSPFEGRTLLLHAEQGIGDAIQFIRYVPLVVQRGGKIILECQPELVRLFRRMAPDLPVLAKGQTLPAFDVHCPLLSLPRLFSTDLGNIPRTVPYLHADAAAAVIWRERIAGLGSSLRPSGLPQSRDPSGPDLKVGLVWAGNPAHKNDRNRSLKPANLARLADVPGVRFISLQKDAATAEARTAPAGMELIDVAEELKDFDDTAAVLANLDLIIAVDTAVVHLAGAMGRPVWTLLPYAPDWRWLRERGDSPWYPTMRLFRQPSIGDWDSVIAKVREQLQVLVDSWRAKS